MNNLESVATIVGISAALGAGVAFVVNMIVKKTKHETEQDNKLGSLIKLREECIVEREAINGSIIERITKLEERDRDRELLVMAIKEKMEALINAHETTQSMIAQLTTHQHETFTSLIKLIKGDSGGN